MDDRTTRRIDQVRVATLATLSADGRPHLVPVVFARHDGNIVTAVDGKPKKRNLLARLENIARDPRVTVLFHHYEEDWSRLWWVRVDGEASILDEGQEFSRSLTALRDRSAQYGSVALGGPAVIIKVEKTSSWEAQAH